MTQRQWDKRMAMDLSYSDSCNVKSNSILTLREFTGGGESTSHTRQESTVDVRRCWLTAAPPVAADSALFGLWDLTILFSCCFVFSLCRIQNASKTDIRIIDTLRQLFFCRIFILYRLSSRSNTFKFGACLSLRHGLFMSGRLSHILHRWLMFWSVDLMYICYIYI